MSKYFSFPVLKRIGCSAVFVALLAIAAVCAGFSAAEAATGTLTTNHWKQGTSEGYAVQISVPDPGGAMNTVTVTSGPGISTPVVLGPDANYANYVGSVDLGTSRPVAGQIYTVVINYLDNTIPDETLNLTVSGVSDSFAAQGSPIGGLVSTTNPTFTWTAPTILPANGYLVAVSGVDQAWVSGTIGNTVTSQSFSTSTGLTLTPGVLYDWSILTVDGNNNTAETRGASFMLGTNFSGKVTDLSGAPISGVSVYVYDSTGLVQTNVGVTGADGTYLYGGLVSGSYKVAFSKPPAFRVFYNNKLTSTDADLLAVTSGNLTQNVNAVLGSWGTVSGKVISSTTGSAIANAAVTLYNQNNTPVAGVATVYTKSDGSYTLTPVPAGSYNLQFSGVSGYLDQPYGQNPVSVIAGSSTQLLDQGMAKIQISGKVTDGNGNPVPNIWIWPIDISTGFYPANYYGVQTASDGTYAIGGIATGSYKVQFDSVKAYAPQYYNRKGTIDAADVVNLGTTPVTNINAVLSSGIPTVTTFTVPTTSKTTLVSVAMAASETNGVIGYMVSESSTPPAAGDAGWLSAPPTSYSFATPGTKTLYAYAKGYTGLVGSASRTILVDTTPPVIALSTLSNLATTSDATLNIAGQVTISNGTIATLLVNGAAVQLDSKHGYFTYPVHLVAGVNNISVVATDTTGLQTTSTLAITYNAAAPALAVTAPADITATTNPTLNVTGTVASGSTVDVFVNGVSQSATVNGTGFSTTVDLVAGINTLEFVATDGSGNTNRAKRSVLLVSDGPDVTVTGPSEDITTNLASYTLSGTVSTTSTTTVNISVGTSSYTPTVDPATGNFSQVIPLVPGVNTISVEAQDASGLSNGVQRNIIVAGKAGDCNLDGIVDLSEVQSAIKMFLGVKTVATCDDLNLDGTVGLDEVQKIIKAFLAP